MNKKDKEWIDNASYEDLLRKQRFAPLGDKFFLRGELSDYFYKQIYKLRDADPNGAVAASKRIGWK